MTQPPKPNAKRLFERELSRRNLQFARTLDGGYKIEAARGTLQISLDNLSRELERDGDPEAIVRFLDSALGSYELPPWRAARSRVYWSAEPHDSHFGDGIRERVTDTVAKVLVVTDEDESRITALTARDVDRWSVSIHDLRAAADRNLDRLLKGRRPIVDRAGEFRVGMIPLDSAFKASVILAPRFKQFVQKGIGWPVLAVIPCRDFVYLLAERDQELLSRMGTVVEREFRGSGYPITTEVLQISDHGIRAIGRFLE